MPEFLNPSILDYVDKWMNCEDLAMCLMVADFLAKVTYPQVSCVGLKAKHYPYNLEAQNSKFKIKKNKLPIKKYWDMPNHTALSITSRSKPVANQNLAII